MIAGLAVMAMIAFVFLSGVPSGSSGGGYRNPVVVKTTKFGNLKQGDVQGLLRQRQSLLAFFRTVRSAVQQAGGDPRRIDGILPVFGPATEQLVVER